MNGDACLLAALVLEIVLSSGLGESLVPIQLAVRVAAPATWPPSQVAGAEAEVKRIYAAEGIDVIWLAGDSALRPPDYPTVTVLLLEGPRADRFANEQNLDGRVLGQASSRAARAYILVERVAELSALGRNDPGDVLGVVLAHEIGHLLLPGYSHSASGIMSPGYNVKDRSRRRFTAEQGALIRQCLRMWSSCHQAK